MKNSYLVIQNKHNQTARVIPFNHESSEVIFRHDLKRIEILNNTESLIEAGVEFNNLAKIDKSSKPGDVVVKGPWGHIKHVEKVDEFIADPISCVEKNIKGYPFFLKWTSALEIGLLLLLLLTGWWLSKKVPVVEEQTVRVIRRIEEHQVVQPTKQKKKIVENHKFAKVMKKNKIVKKIVSIGKPVHSKNIRSGNQIKKLGALSVLGGMNLNSHGLGGLSKTPTQTSGFGFDKIKAVGGSARGMLGKGLVQSGIGNNESLKGYGGTGLTGKGQGQEGYGDLGLAGTSGGYYLPLSDEAIVEGGLDPDQVNAVIQRHRGQLTYCYEKGLQVKPNLSGRVAVNFTISPSGVVNIAKIAHSSLASSQVESCIISKLTTWKFPKPKGNVEVKVSYPFILKRLNQG